MRTEILVKRGQIENGADHFGRFGANEFGRGRVPGAVLRPLGTYCVDTPDKVFALTYDDGPDPSSTPRVLDALAEHDARATFFVLSEPVARHPEIVRRIVDDGHEIALHGENHRSLLTRSTSDAIASIRRSRAIVEDVAQRTVRLYRPPYGSHTLAQGWRILRDELELTLWSSDALDWIDDDPAAVAERAIASIFPGAVLLLHDTRADPETLGPGERLPAFDRAEVLARILTATRGQGYREIPAGELLDRYPRVKSISRQQLLRGLGVGR